MLSHCFHLLRSALWALRKERGTVCSGWAQLARILGTLGNRGKRLFSQAMIFRKWFVQTKRARSEAVSLSFPICTKKETEGWFKPQHNAVLLRLLNPPRAEVWKLRWGRAQRKWCLVATELRGGPVAGFTGERNWDSRFWDSHLPNALPLL